MQIDWTALAAPRPLTDAEQAVLDRLVAHAGNAQLTAQVASVCVTAVCTCGCGSVRLHTDAAALSPAEMMNLSSTGRDDWFSVDCTRVGPDLPDVDRSPGQVVLFQVVLHVVGGLIHELEIFAGEGVAVEVPRPEELTGITLM